MREKRKLTLPVIVEGKYDKNTLSQLFLGVIIPVDGFGVFNSKEKQALIRRIAKDGIIILTDSDGGGRQIRSFLSGLFAGCTVHHLYIPKLPGKERRKEHRSREGLLGVEGMEPDVLLRIFEPYTEGFSSDRLGEAITKLDFFNDGISGGENSAQKRALLAKGFDLPSDISANALLEALNIITDREGYKEKIAELFE